LTNSCVCHWHAHSPKTDCNCRSLTDSTGKWDQKESCIRKSVTHEAIRGSSVIDFIDSKREKGTRPRPVLPINYTCISVVGIFHLTHGVVGAIENSYTLKGDIYDPMKYHNILSKLEVRKIGFHI